MSVATSNLARAMAQQADDAITKADSVLLGIVERVEHDGADPASVARLRKVLAAQVAELPQLDALHIYDEEGNWVANSRSTPPENLNNADREYFVFHRVHEDRGPHIGIPVKSRTTGKLLVPVSRRINQADGSFAGVALATINMDFFMRFYDSLDIGQAGAVALVLESGTMMTRRPYTPEMVGRNMLNTELFRMYLAQAPVGTAYIKSSQHGVTRLTGLANRRQFDVTLDNEYSRAVREASTLALILIDVDSFKQYNDIYGHAAGDECLRSIGQTIANLASRRPGDLAARYGGEELAVLLPNTDVEGAAALAERIRNAVRELEIAHAGAADGFVTLSAGVDALSPVIGKGQPKELIQAADLALYRAKAGGRNRVCTATHTVPA